jgi:hypothetical protein
MGELDGIYWHACSPTNLQNASGILSFPFSLGFCIYIYPFGNLIYPFGTEQGLK